MEALWIEIIVNNFAYWSNERCFGIFVKLNEKEQNKSLLAQNYVVIRFKLKELISYFVSFGQKFDIASSVRMFM